MNVKLLYLTPDLYTSLLFLLFCLNTKGEKSWHLFGIKSDVRVRTLIYMYEFHLFYLKHMIDENFIEIE